MVNLYVIKRSSLLILLTGLLCAACTQESDEPVPPRLSLPQADPQAALYLIEAQDALYRGEPGLALDLADSAEQHESLKTDAFLADIAFLRGRIQGELNHADEATRAYERVLSLDSTYRGASLNMGNLAFKRGQFSKALSYYRNEYELSGDPQILVYMGHGYAELGKVDSAQYAYERAIAQDDSLAEAYIRLSVLYYDNGNVEQALSNAQRAFSLKPDDPDYRYLYGRALLQNERLDEAEEQLRRTIEQQPGHANAHYSLAIVLSRLGREEEAERFGMKVDSLRLIEESIDTFERRTRLYPDDPAAWITYGYALNRVGRTEEAVRAFKVALFKGPDVPDVHILLANTYLRQNQLEMALGHYDTALTLDESNVGAWVNKGICLARMGMPDDARSAWETALSLNPDMPQVREYLAGLAGS